MAEPDDVPQRLTVVETEQNHIKSSLNELIQGSRETQATLLSLSKGFDTLSEAMNQLSELEQSNSKHTDHLIRLQKAVSDREGELLEIKKRLDKKDKIQDRIVTGTIVAIIVLLYNVMPGAEFLKLLAGIVL